MGLNIAIGSTSGAVLIIGILMRAYGTVNNFPSLISFGTTLATIGGIVVGTFVLFSVIRNVKSLI